MLSELDLLSTELDPEFAGYFPEHDRTCADGAATPLSLGGHRRGVDAARKKDEVLAETQSRKYWVSWWYICRF